MLNKLDPRGSGVKGSAEGALAPPLFDMKTLQDIDITGGIDNRQWPVGQINKSSLVNYISDWPLDWLEAYCNISRGIVKQETQQFSNDSLVHNGSVLHYFYNPHGIVDATQRLIFLIEVTLQVYNENRNLMHCAEENDTLDHLMENVMSGAQISLGYNKLQSFIQQCNPNGDSILHVLAKKGNNLPWFE